MRIILAVLGAGTLVAGGAMAAHALEGDTPNVAVPDPAWMAGAWIRQEGDRWADEFWTPPRAGLMIGAARIGRGDRVSSFEHTRIVRKTDGNLVFIAQPGGAPPTEFALVAHADRDLTFANPVHDYPQKVRYWRDGKLLKAEISKMDGSSKMSWSYSPMGAEK